MVSPHPHMPLVSWSWAATTSFRRTFTSLPSGQHSYHVWILFTTLALFTHLHYPTAIWVCWSPDILIELIQQIIQWASVMYQTPGNTLRTKQSPCHQGYSTLVSLPWSQAKQATYRKIFIAKCIPPHHFSLSLAPDEKVELLMTSPISSRQKLKLLMVHM